MLKRISVILLIPLCFLNIQAQLPTHPVAGVHRASDLPVALTGLTLIPEPGEKIEQASILIKNGKIIAVGKDIDIPKEYRILKFNNAWVYPGLIDLWVKHKTSGMQISGCWNQAVHPDYTTFLNKSDTSARNKIEKFRNEGFTTVLLYPDDGIFRGSGTLTHTGSEESGKEIISTRKGMFMSFDKGYSEDPYPASLMGCIALIRQTFLDADWLKTATEKTEKNICLEALIKAREDQSPFFFETNSGNDPGRILALGKEFNQPFIIKTTGRDYETIRTGEYNSARYILPLNFPLPPDLKTRESGEKTGLYALRHWAWAPANPAVVAKANIPFVFTSEGLKNISQWRSMAQKAIDRGLDPDEALAAFTSRPAEWLGMEGKIGCIKPGAFADFVVFSGEIFDPESYVTETWIQGKRYPMNAPALDGPDGVYSFNAPEFTSDSLCFSHSGKTIKAEIRTSTKKKIQVSVNKTGGVWELCFLPDTTLSNWILNGILNGDTLQGNGTDLNGNYFKWTAIKTGILPEKIKEHTPDTFTLPPLSYPNRAWGNAELPKAETWLIRNVQIWTNLEDSICLEKLNLKADLPGGILTSADVLISQGKIQKVGKNLNDEGVIIIDGTGKHLSPGIVDEHSHIAIERGVNEGTQAITAEVRIGDVLRPEDLNIFRQLAGGVTTSQLLHGSANPVGGQSAIIKLRWGLSAEEMKMKEAPPFIKFALGENVKQSNWGERHNTRFPQSRPGVEQILDDAFLRAREYKAEQIAAPDKPFRKDIELETLAEILEGKRFITCHSYVQSEITMLMRIAEKYNFRINTFTHVLEGYKISDKIKAHGASASTFTDWWAYKYEVIDAIPYNGALLAQAGVNTGFNSDDAEMGRRLNQEAAKAVKYGGLSETEALKMVTLNPAKMLRIDAYIGTVEPGKQADLVLWSGHPLSVYSKAEKTWVDGKLFYDADRLAEMAEKMKIEKAGLIRRARAAGAKGTSETPEEIIDRLYHCDTLEDSDHENLH